MGLSTPSLPQLASFDPQAFIQAGVAGKRQQTLAQLGALASKGDYQGAASAAFAGGQPDLGSQMLDQNWQQHQRLVQDAGSLAMSATTPEAWAQAGQQFEKLHPGVQWAPFEQRGQVISQSQTVSEQLANKIQQEDLALKRASLGIQAAPYTMMGMQIPGMGGGGSAAPPSVDGSPQPTAAAPQQAAPQAPQSPQPAPGPAPSPIPGYMGGRFDAAFVPASGASPIQTAMAQRYGAPGQSDAYAGAPPPPAQPASADPTDQRNAYADQALSRMNISPQFKGIVQGIGNYTLDPTKIASIRGSAREMLMGLVQQAYPDFDMTNYGVRQQTQKSFGPNGNNGMALTSNRTAIRHLSQLWDDAQALGNGSFTPLNAIKNQFNTMTGNNATTNVATDMQAVSTEVAKALRGSGAMSESEINDWQKNFSVNASPPQMQGAIQRALRLMGGRNEEMAKTYQAGMQKQMPMFIDPQEANALNKMGVAPAQFDPNFRQDENLRAPSGGAPGTVAANGVGSDELQQLLAKYGGR